MTQPTHEVLRVIARRVTEIADALAPTEPHLGGRLRGAARTIQLVAMSIHDRPAGLAPGSVVGTVAIVDGEARALASALPDLTLDERIIHVHRAIESAEERGRARAFAEALGDLAIRDSAAWAEYCAAPNAPEWAAEAHANCVEHWTEAHALLTRGEWLDGCRRLRAISGLCQAAGLTDYSTVARRLLGEHLAGRAITEWAAPPSSEAEPEPIRRALNRVLSMLAVLAQHPIDQGSRAILEEALEILETDRRWPPEHHPITQALAMGDLLA